MNTTPSLRALRTALALVALSAPACGNPVTDDKIEALGPEVDGVPESEHHRPGQPCVLCHSIAGGASPELAIGGTVFADSEGLLPVEGAEVVLYDAVGDSYVMTSNCIGNFYLEKTGSKDPQFPLAAEVRCPTYDADGNKLEGQKVRSMNSWISRDGSCATCHSLRGHAADSTGWIFCNDPDEVGSNVYPDVAKSCPGKAPSAAGAGGATGAGGAQ